MYHSRVTVLLNSMQPPKHCKTCISGARLSMRPRKERYLDESVSRRQQSFRIPSAAKATGLHRCLRNAGGSVKAIPTENMDSHDNCNDYPLVRAMSVAVEKSEAAVAHPAERQVVALASNAHSGSVDTQKGVSRSCISPTP